MTVSRNTAREYAQSVRLCSSPLGQSEKQQIKQRKTRTMRHMLKQKSTEKEVDQYNTVSASATKSMATSRSNSENTMGQVKMNFISQLQKARKNLDAQLISDLLKNSKNFKLEECIDLDWYKKFASSIGDNSN